MWDQRVHAGLWICHLTCVTYVLHVNVYGTVDTCSLLTPYSWIWKKMSLCCLILRSIELEASGWVKGADEDAFTPAEKHRTLFWWNLWPVVRIYKGCICNDAACLTSSRVGHISVQFVPPGPCLWSWNPLRSLLTETQSDEFQDRKTSDPQRDVRTRKQTGCTGTRLRAAGGDGPRVCTAACHQRAVKMRRTESWLFF